MAKKTIKARSGPATRRSGSGRETSSGRTTRSVKRRTTGARAIEAREARTADLKQAVRRAFAAIHVYPSAKGTWRVTQMGSGASAVFGTQQAALEYARGMAARGGDVQKVKLHKRILSLKPVSGGHGRGLYTITYAKAVS